MLVTGGAGFIGANFVQFWGQYHPDDHIVVLDNLSYAGNLANLAPVLNLEHVQFVCGNVRDETLISNLLTRETIDTVVHFAAGSHVDRSIVEPDEFIHTNIVGTHSLLKAVRRAWLDNGAPQRSYRFHHISTDEVYGSLRPEQSAFTETTPYAPSSPYAASKAASDHLVRAYYQTYGLPVTISNCSNNYGPYQYPEKLIPLTILNALEGKPMSLYGDGLNVRDWLYVEDHCRGIGLMLERGRVGETYNVAGNNEQANIDVVRMVCRLIDEYFQGDADLRTRFSNCPASQGRSSEILITFVKDRPGHDRRYAMDITKACHELGYAPSVGFEAGMRKTLSWYLKNNAWWSSVMEGPYREWIEHQYLMK